MRNDLDSLQHEAEHQASADLRQLQAVEDFTQSLAAGRRAHDTGQSLGHALRDEEVACAFLQFVLLDFGLRRVVAFPCLHLLFGGEGILAELVDVACDAGVGEVVVEGRLLKELADILELRVAWAEEVGFGGSKQSFANLPGRAESVELIDHGDCILLASYHDACNGIHLHMSSTATEVSCSFNGGLRFFSGLTAGLGGAELAGVAGTSSETAVI